MVAILNEKLVKFENLSEQPLTTIDQNIDLKASENIEIEFANERELLINVSLATLIRENSWYYCYQCEFETKSS